jgi:hypothetical protein
MRMLLLIVCYSNLRCRVNILRTTWQSAYGARQNATLADASYWLCLPTPFITVVATYRYSAKAATLGQLPRKNVTGFTKSKAKDVAGKSDPCILLPGSV